MHIVRYWLLPQHHQFVTVHKGGGGENSISPHIELLEPTSTGCRRRSNLQSTEGVSIRYPHTEHRELLEPRSMGCRRMSITRRRMRVLHTGHELWTDSHPTTSWGILSQYWFLQEQHSDQSSPAEQQWHDGATLLHVSHELWIDSSPTTRGGHYLPQISATARVTIITFINP